MRSTVMLLKHMFSRCYTLFFFWRIQRGEAGKDKADDWGCPSLLVRSRNAQPPYKVG